MNTTTTSTQSESIGSDLFWGFWIIVTVIALGAAAASPGPLERERLRSEITVREYSELSDLAKKSCDGDAQLKAAVSKGSITGEQATELRTQLVELARKQSTTEIRDQILGASLSCSTTD